MRSDWNDPITTAGDQQFAAYYDPTGRVVIASATCVSQRSLERFLTLPDELVQSLDGRPYVVVQPSAGLRPAAALSSAFLSPALAASGAWAVQDMLQAMAVNRTAERKTELIWNDS